MTAADYYKKWSENCRIFMNYKPIHSHEDLLKFAEDYHKQRVLKELSDEKIREIIDEAVGINKSHDYKPLNSEDAFNCVVGAKNELLK